MDYSNQGIPIYSKYIPLNGFTYFPKLDLRQPQIYYNKRTEYSGDVPKSVWILDYELIEDIFVYGVHLQAYYSFTEPQFREEVKTIPEHGFLVEDLVDNPRDLKNEKFRKLLKLRHDIVSRLLFRETPSILIENGVLSEDFCYIKDFNNRYLKELFNILKDRYKREGILVEGSPVTDDKIFAKCYYLNYFEDCYISYMLTMDQMESYLSTKKRNTQWDRRSFVQKKRDLNDSLGKNCYSYDDWVNEQKEFKDFINT